MPPEPTGLRAGNYVAVRTGGWLAWIIRMATHSAVNHAFLVTGDGGIIEATPQGGVRRGTLSEYAGCLAVANTGEIMTGAERKAVVAKAESLLNAPYNFIDLAAIGLSDLGWHWKLLLRIARADKALICSQLVCEAGEAATPPLPWLCGKTDASQVTPADLARRPGVEPVTL